MREDIVVLGATGSIGRQTLDILAFSSVYRLVGVSFQLHYEKLEPYLLYFDALKYVGIADREVAKAFQAKHPDYIVFSGEDASVEVLKHCKEATVFNALMGNCGLLPSLFALKQNQDLLLSNKESLVIGSSLIEKERKNSSSHLYPVDSEHVALAKLLKEARNEKIPRKDIEKLIVTASGGALRDKKKEDLPFVTPEEVLHHPTWAMGKKITCDSATLVNKGYEVIEASVLFHYPFEKVGAIICRESLVHAELKVKKEGKEETLLEYSPCSMKVAISYALSKGKLEMHHNSKEDLESIQILHFQEIDTSFYPAFLYTINTYKKYGNVGMIYYNAVDTKAIDAFLTGRISYLQLLSALEYTYTTMPSLPLLEENHLSDIIHGAESFASSLVEKIASH